MKQYLIMCRSLTWAQRGERALAEAGITAYTVKAPQKLTDRGCGYALSLKRDFDKAVPVLKKAGLLKGRIFVKEDNGEYREAEL